MDIKGTIDQIVSKLQGDPNLLENFKKDPIKTIEGISGIDIPDGMEQQVVDGVKAAKEALGLTSEYVFCTRDNVWSKTDAYETFLRRMMNDPEPGL